MKLMFMIVRDRLARRVFNKWRGNSASTARNSMVSNLEIEELISKELAHQNELLKEIKEKKLLNSCNTKEIIRD